MSSRRARTETGSPERRGTSTCPRAWRRSPPEASPESSRRGEELREQALGHGFHEVRIEAGVLRPLSVLDLPVPGDGDERGRLAARARAERSRDLVAVQPRQPQIDQHDIWLMMQ